jgi:hypothetical protein
MVQKAAKFRLIYRELRLSLPSEVPAHEIMRLAHLIIRSYQGDFDKDDTAARNGAHRNVRYKPVDEAIEDGGWWLYSTGEADGELYDRNTSDIPETQAKLKRIFGVEWQSRIPQG